MFLFPVLKLTQDISQPDQTFASAWTAQSFACPPSPAPCAHPHTPLLALSISVNE